MLTGRSRLHLGLRSFEEGETVVRMPGGHLISAECYEQMLGIARKERKPPVDPFTRQELPPSTSDEEMAHFCSAPLRALDLDRFVTKLARSELGEREVSATLGFDVSRHPDARSKVAIDMLSRLSADAVIFAKGLNGSSVPRCVCLREAELVVRDSAARDSAAAQVRELLAELTELREKDAAVVRDALPMLVKNASSVPLDGVSGDELRKRLTFQLRQLAAQEASVSTEFLFCLLVSSTGMHDLRAANPYVNEAEAENLLNLAVAVILHANRVGQINRCMSEARGLLKLLNASGTAATASSEAVSALTLKSATLAEQLLAQRHYVDTLYTHRSRSGSTEPTSADVLRGDGVAAMHYDPRFLLFEFTHNILLRKAQVSLIREFVGAVRGGRPCVKQMLMGGGKTTVVGPMLALMLGDGKMLVLQTMPQALLEQSKATLRATFSAIMRKRVFTLVFERSSELGWGTVEKLHAARRNRGVVLCTASTLKSIQLKLVRPPAE
jgi:hypothetical protein